MLLLVFNIDTRQCGLYIIIIFITSIHSFNHTIDYNFNIYNQTKRISFIIIYVCIFHIFSILTLKKHFESVLTFIYTYFLVFVF